MNSTQANWSIRQMAIYLDIVLNAFTPFWILTPTLQKKKKCVHSTYIFRDICRYLNITLHILI